MRATEMQGQISLLRNVCMCIAIRVAGLYGPPGTKCRVGVWIKPLLGKIELGICRLLIPL